jgi:hypothetical protein
MFADGEIKYNLLIKMVKVEILIKNGKNVKNW